MFYLSIYPSIHPSIYLPMNLIESVYLFVYLSICLSIYLSFCLSLCLSMYLTNLFYLVCPSLFSSILFQFQFYFYSILLFSTTILFYDSLLFLFLFPFHYSWREEPGTWLGFAIQGARKLALMVGFPFVYCSRPGIPKGFHRWWIGSHPSRSMTGGGAFFSHQKRSAIFWEKTRRQRKPMVFFVGR